MACVRHVLLCLSVAKEPGCWGLTPQSGLEGGTVPCARAPAPVRQSAAPARAHNRTVRTSECKEVMASDPGGDQKRIVGPAGRARNPALTRRGMKADSGEGVSLPTRGRDTAGDRGDLRSECEAHTPTLASTTRESCAASAAPHRSETACGKRVAITHVAGVEADPEPLGSLFGRAVSE